MNYEDLITQTLKDFDFDEVLFHAKHHPGWSGPEEEDLKKIAEDLVREVVHRGKSGGRPYNDTVYNFYASFNPVLGELTLSFLLTTVTNRKTYN